MLLFNHGSRWNGTQTARDYRKETEKTGRLKPRAAVETTFFGGEGLLGFREGLLGAIIAPKTIMDGTAAC